MAQPALAYPSGTQWPPQGQWTWDDYLRLPDDGQRYEIVRGVLYVSPAPTFRHQVTVSRLLFALMRFVEEHGSGVVLTAPFDVRLPAIANPVQPDLVFFHSGNRPAEDAKYFEGVPDLVVEVLSPGTRRLDQRVKLEAYEAAGIPECWLVDAEARTVSVYRLDRGRGLYRDPEQCGAQDRLRSTVVEGLDLAVAEVLRPSGG